MTELKTLKDLECIGRNIPQHMIEIRNWVEIIKLKQEAIKIFKNLQSSETIYPLLLNDLPENCKGSLAKDKWDKNEDFRYGTEYGMLAMLFWFFNLKEKNLK